MHRTFRLNTSNILVVFFPRIPDFQNIHVAWDVVKVYIISANDPALLSGSPFILELNQIIAEGSILNCLQYSLQISKLNSSICFSCDNIEDKSYPITINEAISKQLHKFQWLPHKAQIQLATSAAIQPDNDTDIDISPIFKLQISKLMQLITKAVFGSFFLVWKASNLTIEENDPVVLSKLYVRTKYFLLLLVAFFRLSIWENIKIRFIFCLEIQRLFIPVYRCNYQLFYVLGSTAIMEVVYCGIS